MSDTAWTPGPWKIENPQSFALMIVHGDFPTRHQDVAQVALDQADEYDTPEHEARANARLIAASPEMAEALAAFVSHYPSGINPDLDAAWNAARAALAKAQGEANG